MYKLKREENLSHALKLKSSAFRTDEKEVEYYYFQSTPKQHVEIGCHRRLGAGGLLQGSELKSS